MNQDGVGIPYLADLDIGTEKVCSLQITKTYTDKLMTDGEQ